MRVLHLFPGTLEEINGAASAALAMCDSLSAMAIHVEIGSLAIGSPGRQRPFLRSFSVMPGASALGVSPAMRSWVYGEVGAGAVQVIHAHGLWRMPMLYAASALRRGACKLVCSPHGALSPLSLAHHRWRKRLFWRAQVGALRQVSCFLASSEDEYRHIRQLGFAQPVCVLGHGVEVPPLRRLPGLRRTLLYLGRIDDLKGVDLLLKAWGAVERDFPEWDLEIVGPGPKAIVERLRRLAGQLALRRSSFVGPLYGAEKLAAYQRADIFVLPSRSESFGLTVAESLAAGTPAVVTRRAPWQGLESHGAGWLVEPDAASLIDALKVALRTPRPQLQKMGVAGRDWMEREFEWGPIAEKLLTTYRWLGDADSPPPSWVIRD